MPSWLRWVAPVGMTILGAVVASAFYLTTRNIWIASVFVVAALLGAIAGALYGRRASKEVVALIFGVAIGGGDWALVALICEPSDKYLGFLQAHAFDYFTAAGLAGFSLYFLGPRQKTPHPRWRDFWVVTILTVIAAATSLSAQASLALAAEVVLGCIVASCVVVIAMRVLLPTVTPR